MSDVWAGLAGSSGLVAAQGPRGEPEQRGEARQTLRTFWFCGQVRQNLWKTLYILNIRQGFENVSRDKARRTLRTAAFREHARRGWCGGASWPLQLNQLSKRSAKQRQHENVQIHLNMCMSWHCVKFSDGNGSHRLRKINANLKMSRKPFVIARIVKVAC